jgi:hypothetical protein
LFIFAPPESPFAISLTSPAPKERLSFSLHIPLIHPAFASFQTSQYIKR